MRPGAGVAWLANSGTGLRTAVDHLTAVGAATKTATAGKPVLVGTISDVGFPRAMEFDPRGGILSANNASGAQTNFWNVADPANPTVVSSIRAIEDVNAGTFSPDGNYFYIVGQQDDWLTVYSVSDIANPLRVGGTGDRSNRPGGVAVSPNGHIVAGEPFGGAGGGDLVLWDVTDPTLPIQLSVRGVEGSLDISPKAFGLDGRILAIGQSVGGCPLMCGVPFRFYTVLLDVSDPASPTTVATMNAQTGSPLAFSPDGRTLAAAGTSTPAALFDVSTPTSPREVPLQMNEPLTAVAFRPGGAMLATGDGGGTVTLWDVSGDAPKRVLKLANHAGWIRALAFSPDGLTLAMDACKATTQSSSQCADEIQLWRLAL